MRRSLLATLALFSLLTGLTGTTTGCDGAGALPADGASDSSTGDSATVEDGGARDAAPMPDLASTDAAPVEPRVIAASRDGHLASFDLTSPWTVRATSDLRTTVRSVHCRDGRCVVVHPSPADSLHLVSASDLSVIRTIALEAGSDPRDVAIVDDHTAVITQYNKAALALVDLETGAKTSIDLAPLADSDGIPEANYLAACGHRVFVQLRRTVHDTEAASAVPAVLAVVDLDRSGADRLVDVDPNTPGVQGITLADRPDFEMPIQCAANRLYVAEPRPLMKGGGGYEKVDLATLTAADLSIDTGAQVGGFEILDETKYWLITHTEFGPGPSSHLNFFNGGPSTDTHNTFATEHVNDLASDSESDLLFYPDPCATGGAAACDPGVHVYQLSTGAHLSAIAVKLPFPPIEIAVSR